MHGLHKNIQKKRKMFLAFKYQQWRLEIGPNIVIIFQNITDFNLIYFDQINAPLVSIRKHLSFKFYFICHIHDYTEIV